MEKKLEKIEKEVQAYMAEQEEKKRLEVEKQSRLERKRKKEQKYEMMKWIVMYIEKNKNEWGRRRKLELEMRRKEEESEKWKILDKNEKLEILKEEKSGKKTCLTKEEKVKKAKELKKNWSRRESKITEDDEQAENWEEDDEEDVGLEYELEKIAREAVEDASRNLENSAKGEQPGQDNILQEPSHVPGNQGGAGGGERRRAYHEIPLWESNAPSKAAPLTEGEIPEEQAGKLLERSGSEGATAPQEHKEVLKVAKHQQHLGGLLEEGGPDGGS